MNLKIKIYRGAGYIIRRLNLYNYVRLKKDKREPFPYKLVTMCGTEGIRYLNASLVSIYLSWEKLPEICVVSDGTPISKFEKELIKWPRRLEIISWEDCARHFKMNGNEDLLTFANNNVYGKKFLSLLYYAEKFPILYSDTDVIWYSSPEVIDITARPFIKMSREMEHCFYANRLIKSLKEERCLESNPFNSGLMYLSGDFSVYPKWKELCNSLGSELKNDAFIEQTAFAILNNHFNAESYWPTKEILIKTDDRYNLKYTGKYFPQILARHYVNTRRTAFWRDFIFMCLQKNRGPVFNCKTSSEALNLSIRLNPHETKFLTDPQK